MCIRDSYDSAFVRRIIVHIKFINFRGGRIFSQKVALPIDADVEFRYFVAVICHSNGTKNSAKTLIIRRWETHMTPRFIKKNGM